MSAYLALLGNPQLSLHLRWDGGTGPVTYNNWPINLQNDLLQAIEDRESGIVPTNYEPPSAGPFDNVSDQQAWEAFLRHVAQSLGVEKNQIVPWSLLTMPHDHVEHHP